MSGHGACSTHISGSGRTEHSSMPDIILIYYYALTHQMLLLDEVFLSFDFSLLRSMPAHHAGRESANQRAQHSPHLVPISRTPKILQC
jgi:hypothetical protein